MPNGSSGKPSSCFSSVISSAPSAEPWTFSLPCRFGSGQPMMVCNRISDGLLVTCWAAMIASYSSWMFSP